MPQPFEAKFQPSGVRGAWVALSEIWYNAWRVGVRFKLSVDVSWVTALHLRLVHDPHSSNASVTNRSKPMDTQTDAIRALSSEECENTAGGIGWFVIIAALAGGAASGSLLAYCTAAAEEKPLIPDIQFPS